MMDLLFIWRGPSPYRVDFFNELGKSCNLTVFFELKADEITDRERTWFHEDFQQFEAIYLKNIFIKKTNIAVNLVPSVRRWRKKHPQGIIVVGMYSTPSQSVLITYLKIARIPYFLNSDGGFVKNDNALRKGMKRFLIRGARGYLSTSRKTTEYLTFYGADPDKTYCYPFTTYKEGDLPDTMFDKSAIRQELGLDQKSKYIISVGQFIPRKGFDILLKAAKFFQDNVKILLAGGQPTDLYLALCRELPTDMVQFIGFLGKGDLEKYYKAADLFVFPTREDIWGLVVNEAMSLGLPVVTTDACIAGVELVENGKNGYIVPAENETALAECVNAILRDQERAEAMSRANIEKMQHYTIESMAQKHMEIFEEYERTHETN